MDKLFLAAARRLLFFSVDEAAALIGSVHDRTWRMWEAGQKPIPADVTETVMALLGWRERMFDTTCKQIASAPPNTEIPLIWYSSADDWIDSKPIFWKPHMSVVSATAVKYADCVRLVEFDPVAYSRWLAGRVDSPDMRETWATEMEDGNDLDQ